MLCNVNWDNSNKRKQKKTKKQTWLSFVPPVRVPEFFEVTFDRFFSGAPKLSKMAKYGQKEAKKKSQEN